MSNLLKSVYFNVNPQQRVIASDERVEEFIPDIYHQPPAADASFPSFEDGEGAGEFEDGLSVISMRDVAEEERNKLEEELREEQEQILNAAREEAQGLIAAAKEEADSIRILAQEEGRGQGREQGRKEAAEELQEMRQQLEEEYRQKQKEFEEQEEALEPAFAEIVVSLVRKLTGIVCEDKKDVILFLIGSALKNLERPKEIVIRISEEDEGRVLAKKETLKKIANVESFEIIEDKQLSANQCMIETDNRIIDCGLDTQLDNLAEHIRLLTV